MLPEPATPAPQDGGSAVAELGAARVGSAGTTGDAPAGVCLHALTASARVCAQDDVAGTPRKRPRLSSVMSADVVPAVNMNPIAPCGACHEWLKKIAEVNPDFKVVTFADDSCEQVFVQPVLD